MRSSFLFVPLSSLRERGYPDRKPILPCPSAAYSEVISFEPLSEHDCPGTRHTRRRLLWSSEPNVWHGYMLSSKMRRRWLYHQQLGDILPTFSPARLNLNIYQRVRRWKTVTALAPVLSNNIIIHLPKAQVYVCSIAFLHTTRSPHCGRHSAH